MLSRRSRYLGIGLLVLMLAAVRAFEDVLFYDPFLQYYRTDYAAIKVPAFNWGLYFLNLMFRYAINSVLSLGIIWLFFRKLDLIRFALLLYVVLFVVLAGALFAALIFLPENKMLIFYIRRFLIQPLFLLLFLPGFFFQEKMSRQ